MLSRLVVDGWAAEVANWVTSMELFNGDGRFVGDGGRTLQSLWYEAQDAAGVCSDWLRSDLVDCPLPLLWPDY